MNPINTSRPGVSIYPLTVEATDKPAPAAPPTARNDTEMMLPPSPGASLSKPRVMPRANALLMAKFNENNELNTPQGDKVTLRGGGRHDAGSSSKSAPQDPTYFDPLPGHRQTRMADCWYAAMKMVLQGKYGEEYKPSGETVTKARGLPLLGKKLSFGSREGLQIMEDNGFVGVGHKIVPEDSGSIGNLLDRHGPFIVMGSFDLLSLGHAVVVVGVDHPSQQICVQDPAKKNAAPEWLPLDYLKNTHRSSGSDNIDVNSAIALSA
ncbi:papain-like cysteine protease family protein [Pseudomonas fluorescens]|nr:papain-like cysteine protease family protein [Pseudomonas fluorescens]